MSVPEKFEKRHYDTRVLELAERKAREGGAKILQCTVRVGNLASMSLFDKHHFVKTVTFFNEESGNWVQVLQKCMATGKG